MSRRLLAWGYPDSDDFGARSRVHGTSNPDAPLMLYPHYSDPIWREAQAVYGREEKGLTDYVYSDRMWQWDYDKARASFALAGEAAKAGTVTAKSAKWLEIALSHYCDKPVEGPARPGRSEPQQWLSVFCGRVQGQARPGL